MPATLSRRIEGLKASSTVAFAGRAKELARQGVNVISMTAGEPDFLPPQHVLDAALEAIDLGLTKYTPSEGTAELREAGVMTGGPKGFGQQERQRFAASFDREISRLVRG